MPELRPFQKIGRDFLVNHKAALLADEQGLGKTPEAITAINALKARKVLIVCKAIGKITWPGELKTWLDTPLKIQVLNGKNAVVNPDSEIVILNYDLLTSSSVFTQLVKMSFAVGVFDESHYLKNASAKRTKAVLLRGAVASRCVYKWFLTGTPVLNRPIELYPLLKSVAPHVIEPYTTHDSFARRYCDGYWDGFQLVTKGATNVEELNCRLVNSGFMLRRLKKDVLKELPDKQYQIISLPAPDSKTKELVKKEFTFSKDDAKRYSLSESGSEIARIRHELAIAKTDTCIDHIKDVLDETPKVVVFAYHRAVIAKIAEAFGVEAVTLTGDTSFQNRVEAVARFQKDPSVRVFIGQIQAAGDTITLTASSHVIFVESSWVPGEVDQATDRCHRIGQKDAVLVQFLVLAESLEENIIRTMIDKKLTIRRIIDEDPAISYLFT